MIISSEIENVEKVENLSKDKGKSGKSILRAFARTRAKNYCQNLKSMFFFGWPLGMTDTKVEFVRCEICQV